MFLHGKSGSFAYKSVSGGPLTNSEGDYSRKSWTEIAFMPT